MLQKHKYDIYGLFFVFLFFCDQGLPQDLLRTNQAWLSPTTDRDTAESLPELSTERTPNVPTSVPEEVRQEREGAVPSERLWSQLQSRAGFTLGLQLY